MEQQPEQEPKIVEEVTFDHWCAHREGNRIFFIPNSYRPAGLLRSSLVILLTEEGGLALDSKWEERRRLEIQRERKWKAIIRRLCLPFSLESVLSALRPPQKGDQIQMIAGLRKIAQGKTNIELDDEDKEILAEALDWAYSTARL